jgi:hypothetical protein
VLVSVLVAYIHCFTRVTAKNDSCAKCITFYHMVSLAWDVDR